MKSIPVVANISSAKYSPVGRSSSFTHLSDMSTVRNVVVKKIKEKKSLRSSVMIIPRKDVSAGLLKRLIVATAAATSPMSDAAPATFRSILRDAASIIIMMIATAAVIASGNIA